MGFFRWINDTLEKVETFLVSFALIFMIVLAFLQVMLRNFFNTGLGWGDLMVRVMVLWVGFIGASIATHKRSHIRFDVVAKFLPAHYQKVTKFIVSLGSAVVCFFLAYAAYSFVFDVVKLDGNVWVEGVPWIGAISEWVVWLVVPVVFLIMSFRMSFNAVLDFSKIMKKGEEQ